MHNLAAVEVDIAQVLQQAYQRAVDVERLTIPEHRRDRPCCPQQLGLRHRHQAKAHDEKHAQPRCVGAQTALLRNGHNETSIGSQPPPDP